MFRKISDMRVEYLFGLEIDMNSSDLELKERIIEIFKLLKKDIVKFYNEISKTNSYINENFKGSIYKKQIDRLERLIKEIATEKKKFDSSEKVKFNIGDTVTLKYTEGLGHSPFISMHRAYEIINLDNKRARISDDKISIVVPLEALDKIKEPSDELKFKIDVIIDESFMEKLKEETEKIRVVRKLEDLDGLENSKVWKLSFESTDNFKDKGYYQEWVRLDDKSDKGWFNAFYELTDKTIDLLRIGGFKFEYKPLRTEEEIMADLIEKKFKFGEGNYILIEHEHGCYDYMNNTSFYTPGQKYYSLESLKKVVKELNELLSDKND